MKQTLVISIILLLLLPIFRNGLALFHYVLEHTHLFCSNDLEQHTHVDNCLTLTILQSSQNQNQLPSPTKIEIQELKLYCLTSCLHICPTDSFSTKQVDFVNFFPPDNLFSKDIFHPPILA